MPTLIRNQMNFRDWALLILLSFLWGGSFFFVEIILTQLPPLSLVAMRLGLAAVALWGVVLFTRTRLPCGWHTWGVLVILGAINNAMPFSLIVWGQTQITSGLASILNATTPLFGVIVAGWFLADERASLRKFVGVLIGFIGVVLMFTHAAATGHTSIWPQLAILAATFSYAVGGIYGRRLKKMDISPLVSSAGQISMAFLMLLPMMIYWEGLPTLSRLDPWVWGAIGGLAVLSTAVAYILYFSLLETVGATNVLLVTLLVPVSAVCLGVALLGESLYWSQVFGMACIGLGLLVVDGRWRRSNLFKRSHPSGG